MPPGWSPGARMWAQGARPLPTPQIFAGTAQPKGKIYMPVSTPSPQLEPPTAGALNLSRDPSSAGRGFRGIPGAPSSLPSGSSVSPLGFLSPTPGLPGVPLLGGPGFASGSCDRRKLRRSNSTPPSSPGGDQSSGLFPQLRGPEATSPPRTGGCRAEPRALRSPTSGSIQSSRVPGGGVTSLSRSWPLRPDPVPVAEPLAARPKAGVAAAVQVSHQSFAWRMWGGRAERATRLRPGARGATGCAGQRAGGCAPGRRRQRRPGAPACARSSGQTSFSPSVALGLVQRRRPPPPARPLPRLSLPPPPVRLPRAADTSAGRPLTGNGGRLKGTPRLFLAPAQPRGLPRRPRPARPARPAPPAPGPETEPHESRARLGHLGRTHAPCPSLLREPSPPPGGTPSPAP